MSDPYTGYRFAPTRRVPTPPNPYARMTFPPNVTPRTFAPRPIPLAPPSVGGNQTLAQLLQNQGIARQVGYPMAPPMPSPMLALNPAPTPIALGPVPPPPTPPAQPVYPANWNTRAPNANPFPQMGGSVGRAGRFAGSVGNRLGRIGPSGAGFAVGTAAGVGTNMLGNALDRSHEGQLGAVGHSLSNAAPFVGTAAGSAFAAGLTGGAMGAAAVPGTIGAFGVGLGTLGVEAGQGLGLIDQDNNLGNVWKNVGMGDQSPDFEGGELAAFAAAEEAGVDMDELLAAALEGDSGLIASRLGQAGIEGVSFNGAESTIKNDSTAGRIAETLSKPELLTQATNLFNMAEMGFTATDVVAAASQIEAKTAEYLQTEGFEGGEEEARIEAETDMFEALAGSKAAVNAQAQAEQAQVEATQRGLAFQAVYNRFVAPSTNQLRSTADQSYADTMSQLAYAPPELQAVLANSAATRYQNSHQIATAYEAQAATFVPMMQYQAAAAQQTAYQDRLNQAMFEQEFQQDWASPEGIREQQFGVPGTYGVDDQTGSAAAVTAEQLIGG